MPFRPSFRQFLVAAFLLVSVLLAAVAVRSLFTLERLMSESRKSADREVQLNVSVQTLAERNVAMERSARQFLVLNDPILRTRFNAAAREASQAIDTLAVGPVSQARAREWRSQLEAIEALLSPSRRPARLREQQLVAAFRELDRINATIEQDTRIAAQAQSQALLEDLEESRKDLTRLVLGAIVIALTLAIAFGLWLARPLKRLEGAIVALGDNRLDEAIEINGPADVRQLGRQLDRLRLRLSEIDADKARFLRQVSHELKTPLAALREGVAVLEEGVAGALSDKQRRVAQILAQNTAQLQSQIEDLLRLNAAAFEARRLVRRPTELGPLVSAVVEAQRLQADARGLQVAVTGPAIRAEVDPEKLGTAIANLLSNAIRFSPRGGTIDIRLESRDGAACIDVSDQGPGVAHSDRGRIFEPFFRGEIQPEEGQRGSGIGLSIVYENVVAHGGTVSLVPDTRGARFRIELPHAVVS